jgi:hypothetical protein
VTEDELTSSNQHQVASGVTNSVVESLFVSLQTADEEAKAQAEEQVGKYTTQNGSTYDGYAGRAIMLE